jgi:predicted deacylase
VTRAARPPFEIAGNNVPAGRRVQLELPIAQLMSGTPVALPVIVLHGKTDGPVVWLSAVVHGDELCGVEIIRRVLESVDPKVMSGTVIAVPIVNVHGFNTGDRYLPDRRDLNRSFPGSLRGSLAGRIAHLMMSEVVSRCSVGIDLHTGSDHRINLPQVRADLDDEPTHDLARVFGAPISMHSRTRDCSLRQAATEIGATTLLFEGGEANRFDETAIASGTGGVLRVLAHLDMIDPDLAPNRRRGKKVQSRSSSWVRAPRSGILHLNAELGGLVDKGEIIATVHDPFGKRLSTIRNRAAGIVVGHTQHPLVNRGDAVVHVAAVAGSA